MFPTLNSANTRVEFSRREVVAKREGNGASFISGDDVLSGWSYMFQARTEFFQ